jgi:GH15 family glucan-1,4-alpha-glucosidase
MTTILSGHVMTKDEKAQILASLEARAKLAEENGLPKTAKYWREAAENFEDDTVAGLAYRD